MKIYTLNIVLIFVIILTACVESIDVNIGSASGKLVVEGTITDQPGPYTVRLSKSKDFFDIATSPSLFKVENAQVSIEDNQGNAEVFSEASPGVYQSSADGMTGIIGRSYILRIKLEDGSCYESNTELLRQNVGINTFDVTSEKREILNENNFVTTIDGVELNILPNDFRGTDAFYRWRWEGTYEVETSPQLKDSLVVGSNNVRVPNPPPCSGYIAIPPTPPDTEFVIQLVKTCECCLCWVTESSGSSFVSATSTGQNKVNLGFIQNENGRFGKKYHIKIEQLSLSKGAHEFWKIIQQQQNSGSLFAASNAEIPTNIKSVDDQNEKVLGYFIASSVAEVSTFLNISDLISNPVLFGEIKEDCRIVNDATNQKPLFW